MIFLIILLILVSVYVASNEKIEEKNKTGYFAFVGAITLLYIVFDMILK